MSILIKLKNIISQDAKVLKSLCPEGTLRVIFNDKQGQSEVYFPTDAAPLSIVPPDPAFSKDLNPPQPQARPGGDNVVINMDETSNDLTNS